jgi:hypothetical protein
MIPLTPQSQVAEFYIIPYHGTTIYATVTHSPIPELYHHNEDFLGVT